MFISMARFMPKMRVSYSGMLFVQVNSNLYEKRVFSLSGEIKNIPAP